MQIDWLTTIAQVINFLVLVWLLKRFLYRPVIEVMDRREQRIGDRLEQAREREAEAEAAIQDCRERQRELEAGREQFMEDAREAARERREQWLEEAREAVEARRREWLDDLEAQQARFHRALRRELGRTLMQLGRRALADLADAELESRVVAVFRERIEALADEERRALAQAAREAGALVVAAAHEPGAEVRERLASALDAVLDLGETPVRFEVDPELLGGLELRTGDRVLGWNLAQYLDELAIDLEALTQAPGAEARGHAG